MKLTKVSSTGGFSFEFSQDMFYPKTIDQEFYNNVFKIMLISEDDGSSRWTGEFADKSLSRNLEEQEGNRLQFNMMVEEHSAKKISIKTNFAKPNEISRVGKDNFYIRII
jgi:hypothetical protein